MTTSLQNLLSDERLLETAQEAVAAARALAESCIPVLDRAIPLDNGRRSEADLNAGQRVLHGTAWVWTVVETLDQTLRWGRRLAADGLLGRLERLTIRIGFGEYLGQLAGGIAMSQAETVRLRELGLAGDVRELESRPAVQAFLDFGNTAANRAALVDALSRGDTVSDTLGDGDLDMIRAQFVRFVDERIAPFAHQWHLDNALVPDSLIAEMAELGVFGISADPEYGGMGMSKLAMCVITEELSKGWIAVGSIGTRSEIACELIAGSGTEEQKRQWLGRIVSGEILTTAVFTEPDQGSDLARVRTRAVAGEDGWRLSGNKTWITHGSRSDLMTVLARSDASKPGHEGLSLFLAPKLRGSEGDLFPSEGMEGGEIHVLGYRGMREYDIAFDGFAVPRDALLGGVEGQGFKQLMRTFESARIQTAARAVGVARNALALGLRYAIERKQFGRPLRDFPRVADKLALMAVETVMVRELTYFAARRKDEGTRCDIEAGMAKLLAARVAWSNADAALQIHGGNGFALEFEISRVLCDARVLNIFEGAAEIQAHVIGRGLLATHGTAGPA
ncbi:MAG: acyl-CoA/acyl-ACP dehydrogenase [Sphingomonas sp.]|uniref:acyl-CoA dehydrogenase family protein n=1 Tax=Sphingomonas sp. TaxID=28214 RepID=UPI0025DAF7DC|nr:acyl-CoA dehydrogenase family protein [Sphingomonas sp.]MBX3563528.1 acyl-CoA/acyl-ACP dehydrogenase [Sphingomonas sp.]